MIDWVRRWLVLSCFTLSRETVWRKYHPYNQNTRISIPLFEAIVYSLSWVWKLVNSSKVVARILTIGVTVLYSRCFVTKVQRLLYIPSSAPYWVFIPPNYGPNASEKKRKKKRRKKRKKPSKPQPWRPRVLPAIRACNASVMSSH